MSYVHVVLSDRFIHWNRTVGKWVWGIGKCFNNWKHFTLWMAQTVLRCWCISFVSENACNLWTLWYHLCRLSCIFINFWSHCSPIPPSCWLFYLFSNLICHFWIQLYALQIAHNISYDLRQCNLLICLFYFETTGKLVLKIPWKNLYSEPVVAQIDGLYLLVRPNTGMFSAALL